VVVICCPILSLLTAFRVIGVLLAPVALPVFGRLGINLMAARSSTSSIKTPALVVVGASLVRQALLAVEVEVVAQGQRRSS